MRKLNFALPLLAVLLILSGCSINNYGTPTELVGTWTGTYSDGSSESVAGSYEGTWVYTSIDAPDGVQTTVATDGTTSYYYDDTETITTTKTVVVNYDGSGTLTEVVLYDKAYRAAITDANTSGYTAEQVAGTKTITTTYTFTDVETADGEYTETATQAVTAVATGSYVGDTVTGASGSTITLTTSAQSDSKTTITEESTPSLYSYIYSNSYDFTQTVYPEDREATSVTTYTYTFGDDGSFTEIMSTVVTQTAPSAGTTTSVATYTGTVVGKAETAASTGILSFIMSNYALSNSGTGDLISDAYPETAITCDYDVSITYQYDYYISGDKLMLSYGDNPEALVALTHSEE
jgi:hypothetical protein